VLLGAHVSGDQIRMRCLPRLPGTPPRARRLQRRARLGDREEHRQGSEEEPSGLGHGWPHALGCRMGQTAMRVVGTLL
jgi:hypothetical protein